MKLGTAWYGFRKNTASNYFEMATALGVGYVEIPLYWHLIDDRFFRCWSRQDFEVLHSAAKRSGVRMISALADLPTGGSLDSRGDDIDHSAVEFGLAAARRAIDVSGTLGVEVLRISEANVNPDRLHEARSHMEAMGAAMHGLGEYAAARGVRIVVENYGVTSEQVNWLLEAADHPWVGTLYDPCNYYRMGEDPVTALGTWTQQPRGCRLHPERDRLGGPYRQSRA